MYEWESSVAMWNCQRVGMHVGWRHDHHNDDDGGDDDGDDGDDDDDDDDDV